MAEQNQRASSHSDSDTDVNKTTEFVDLPIDIIADIMSRFSTKSLMQFKSLNKPWCVMIQSLVSDEVFIANHHRRAESRPSFILLNVNNLLREPSEPLLQFVTLVSDMVETESDIRCVPIYFDTSRVNGSLFFHCNGIACYTSHDRLTLFSPAMNEFSTFRPNLAGRGDDGYHEIIGLGFGSDSGSTNFKFVRIMKTLPCISGIMTAQVCDISDDRSWREIEVPFLGNERKYDSDYYVQRNYGINYMAVYADGYCYWLFKPICLCFDVARESFRVVDLPAELEAAENALSITRLVSHEGSLRLVNHLPQQFLDYWVMMKDEKDGSFSWSKRARIECPSEGLSTSFCFCGSHKLLTSGGSGDVAAYDFLSKEFKKLVLDGDESYIYYFAPFVDSLASLNWMINELAR